MVGNAPADPSNNSYGDSFVKLTPSADTLGFAGAAIPPMADIMDAKDLDLGAGGLIVIPGTQLLIGGGKTGTAYLVDGSTMTILQSFQAFHNQYHINDVSGNWDWGCPVIDSQGDLPPGCANWSAGPHMHGSPIYWQGADAGSAYFYSWSEKDHLKQFRFDIATAPLDETPALGGIQADATQMPGGLSTLSSNGNIQGSGIIWATLPDIPNPADPNGLPSTGSSWVFAFSATRDNNQTLPLLWSSKFPANLSIASHHAPPTISDGKLILAASSGILVYRLGSQVAKTGKGQQTNREQLIAAQLSGKHTLGTVINLRQNESPAPYHFSCAPHEAPETSEHRGISMLSQPKHSFEHK